MPHPCYGIVLAAGKGTRMKSDLPKVLHPVLGLPTLSRVLTALDDLCLKGLLVIVGHQAERVETAIQSFGLKTPVKCIVQAEQLGTGHAIQQVLPYLEPEQEADVLITCGDMPLVPAQRYADLLMGFQHSQHAATLVTVSMPNPTGYGRVVSEDGRFLRIVEEKDATPSEKAITAINSGIYTAYWPDLADQLARLQANNAQREYYLTDAFGGLVGDGQSVKAETWPDPDEVLGINSRAQLSEAATLLSRRTASFLMDQGVSIVQPETCMLAPEIWIGPETTLLPGCFLEGPVRIGSACEIGPNTVMRGNITIADDCKIVSSFLERHVEIGAHSYIGPFAHLRDNAIIGETVRIGNFVEVKETRFGSRSNAAHLCYLGDADIGDEVNMGAGSIIANYDPVLDRKYRSVIENGVKIGCNSVLVSPLTIAENSSVAAGSVITHPVAAWDLAIARARQTSIPQWVRRKRDAQNRV